MPEEEIYNIRRENKIFPVYKMIDTCAAEFDSYIPYFYSTYEEENESEVSDKKKIIVLGSGPIMPLNTASPAKMISRGGRIPAPLQSLKN